MTICVILPINLISSCSSVRLIKKYDTVNPEFKPYIQDFIASSNGIVEESDVSNLTMEFKDYGVPYRIAGTCWPHLTEIDVNKDWWEDHKSHLVRQELIYHELGHCILRRPHTTISDHGDDFIDWVENELFKLGIIEKKGLLPDNCPASYMHPVILSERCIRKHYNYYVTELFNPDLIYYNLYGPFVEKNKCPEPTIINKTKTWVNLDEWTFHRSKKVCLEEYKSCLETFVKIKEKSYNAICGD